MGWGGGVSTDKPVVGFVCGRKKGTGSQLHGWLRAGRVTGDGRRAVSDVVDTQKRHPSNHMMYTFSA